jgi:hypothetical protein
MKAVDEIKAKHGRDAIRFGAARHRVRWKTKFLRRSRRYTRASVRWCAWRNRYTYLFASDLSGRSFR